MVFGNKNINGYIGDGVFWLVAFGYGFLLVDTSINQLTINELGNGGTFIGRIFLRAIKPE